ncbi:ATP-dependent RNA helicase DDX1 [Trichinella spiralis]|uniref:ATP-dependent RNA helicase n=1 Tax=Trichinella spiralis TaxID=6334 RepID=A0A0V1BTK5_TRISP|nr:ATP-dependent RNA helicase DDX1 [Trichinella spiralis]
MTAFEEMGVLSEIAKAVDEMEWVLPTDVQSEAIPAILGGGDVLMAAETGSGKTGAFCLPILQIVWEALKDATSGKMAKSALQHKPEAKSLILNVYDRGDAIAISPDGLLCQSRDEVKWHGTRATKGVTGKGLTGKYYYEIQITDEGLCRVGFSTIDAALDLGTDAYGFGYGGTGKKSHLKQFDNYGEAFGLNDVIGCFINLDDREVKFSRNGKIFPVAFSIPTKLDNSAFFPAIVLKNAEVKFNFGSEPFKYPPSGGYIGIREASDDCTVDSKFLRGYVKVDTKPKPNAPLCIIIEPSRELAEQTDKQMEKFKKYLDNPKIRNLAVVGGVGANEQIVHLKSGVEIVTGTPGRIEEFISTGQLSLSQIRFFVLDEADGLLQQGYGRFINKLYSEMPKFTVDGKRLQIIVCSATLHNMDVKNLAVSIYYSIYYKLYLIYFKDKIMHFPQWIDLKGQDSVPETVHHVVALVNPVQDLKWITSKARIKTDNIHLNDDVRPGTKSPETLSEGVKLLKGVYILEAIKKNDISQCFIFCRTKLDCDNLEKWLTSVGKYSCVCLHSDRSPAERKNNLQLFKDNKVQFLICTDVAARGIDIRGIPFVINYTLPDDKANYLHRIGRVGRAERMGLAISLVSTVPEKVWYHTCPSRGKSCKNTNLVENGGCAIWYNEMQLLGEIEEHLGVTITQIDIFYKVPVDEFDGKVVYGHKKQLTASNYESHANELLTTVSELTALEKAAQISYHQLRCNPLS